MTRSGNDRPYELDAEKHRAAKARHRADLAERGFCSRCTTRPVSPGYRSCDACRLRVRKDSERTRKRELRRDPSRCTRCGGPNMRAPDARTCAKCQNTRLIGRKSGRWRAPLKHEIRNPLGLALVVSRTTEPYRPRRSRAR